MELRCFCATVNFLLLPPTIRRKNQLYETCRGATPHRGTVMRIAIVVVAALAAATSVAVAKDLKQDKKAVAPAAAASQMSDAEMDKVTAGGFVVINGEVRASPPGLEAMSMNTGPNPAGVLENKNRQVTMGPQ